MSNHTMNMAKKGKKDEFYTQMVDIENELKHYVGQFRDMIIFLNCDDPEESNFWKYFSMNFENFGLKKLIATHYKKDTSSYKLETTDGVNTIRTNLIGDGDFRSQEAIEALKECDIVVTNPPFSLFREYVNQLIEYDKKFLIIGQNHAITGKDIFKHIKEKKIWFGYGFKGDIGHFINKHYENYAVAGEHIEGLIRVSGVAWFTNIDTGMRHKALDTGVTYDPEIHQRYIDHDAINVDRVAEIPMDYFEPMGVPITFIKKWNPEQFEVIAMGSYFVRGSEKKTFKRVTIKRKSRRSS